MAQASCLIIVFLCVVSNTVFADSMTSPDPRATVVASLTENWLVDSYNQPSWEQTPSGMTIRGDGPPAGLFFRTSLNPAQQYLLKIVGSPGSIAVNLRIRQNTDEPQWYGAPNGTATYPVKNTKELEVLIYADSAFEYRLEALQLVHIGSGEHPKGQPPPYPVTDMPHPDLQMVSGLSGWDIVPYNRPRWRVSDQVLTIANDGKPAGISFRKALEPDKTYIVSIEGQSVDGLVNFRTTKNGTAPLYIPAVEGQASWVFAQIHELEILIYHDLPFAYELKKLSIRECLSCAAGENAHTDLPLKKLSESIDLLRVSPGQASDVQKAALILRWISERLDYDNSVGCRIERQTYSQLIFASLTDTLQLFEKDLGGLCCGGLATVLAKALGMYSIPSFLLSFGDEHFAHTTLVVPVQADGYKFYVFDPTFNLVIMKKEGRDIADLFFALDHSTEVEPAVGSLKKRDYTSFLKDAHQCDEVVATSSLYASCRRADFSFSTQLIHPDFSPDLGCLNRPSAVARFLASSCRSRLCHLRWSNIFNHTRGLLGRQMSPILMFIIY